MIIEPMNSNLIVSGLIENFYLGKNSLFIIVEFLKHLSFSFSFFFL